MKYAQSWSEIWLIDALTYHAQTLYMHYRYKTLGEI
jgi:hypothetical protein